MDTLSSLEGVVGWGLEHHGSSAFSAEELLGVVVMLVAIGVIDELEVLLAIHHVTSPLFATNAIDGAYAGHFH